MSANSALTLPSPKQLAWLLLQPAGRRSDPEATIVARVERDADVSRVAALLRDFTALVSASGCHRRAEGRSTTAVARFADWLERAAACGVAALATFAAGLRQDGAAGLSRFDPALEQRAGRRADQPPQVPQAPDGWPRQL